MQIHVIDDPVPMGLAAAQCGAQVLREALRLRGRATVVVPTGASQFTMHDALVQEPGIDWSRVTVFHLDEYIGLPITHGASFRGYLRDRFLTRLPVAPVFVSVDGDAPDLAAELARLNGLLAGQAVDLCLAGIGENGHLAFNDPPCDFEVDDPYIVVVLDDGCRKQQLGEGWFPSLEAVPRQAISMSIRQIMRSACLVLTVPDQRKAVAVRRALAGAVDNSCPASIVQRHGNCVVFLDAAAASLLGSPPAARG
jgi:glucosamine-6-phosphate deaminase